MEKAEQIQSEIDRYIKYMYDGRYEKGSEVYNMLEKCARHFLNYGDQTIKGTIDEAVEEHRKELDYMGMPCGYKDASCEGFKAGAKWMAEKTKFNYTKGHHTAMVLSRECMNEHGWFQREREMIELKDFIENLCGYEN